MKPTQACLSSCASLDNIIIARDGIPVVQMTLRPKAPKRSIIGAAKKDGDFSWPENFNELDDEIADMFLVKYETVTGYTYFGLSVDGRSTYSGSGSDADQ